MSNESESTPNELVEWLKFVFMACCCSIGMIATVQGVLHAVGGSSPVLNVVSGILAILACPACFICMMYSREDYAAELGRLRRRELGLDDRSYRRPAFVPMQAVEPQARVASAPSSHGAMGAESRV